MEEEFTPIRQYKSRVKSKDIKRVILELEELGFKSKFLVKANKSSDTLMYIWPFDQKYGEFASEFEFVGDEKEKTGAMGHVEKDIWNIIGEK